MNPDAGTALFAWFNDIPVEDADAIIRGIKPALDDQED